MTDIEIRAHAVTMEYLHARSMRGALSDAPQAYAHEYSRYYQLILKTLTTETSAFSSGPSSTMPRR